VRQQIQNEIAENKSTASYSLIHRMFTLGNRQGTLMQCLVTGFDHAIKDSNDVEIEQGLSDILIEEIQSALPD